MNKLFSILILLFLIINSLYAQKRIVTAGSSSSEIICSLGLCDNIIATDRTSSYPPKLTTLPSIGYRNGINAEGIIAQEPDLVIVENGYVKQEVIDLLNSAKIKVLELDQKRNIQNTFERIRAIADAVGRIDEGENLIIKIKDDFEQLEVLKASSTANPKVLCVYNRGKGNLMAGGTKSPFSIVDFSGAQNAIPSINGLKPLNTESLILSNPDYVLFFDSGLKSIGGKSEVLKITGLSQTNAGRNGQIISMDGILLTNWGPRIGEAALQLFKLTHPKSHN